MLESDDIHLFQCGVNTDRPPGPASYVALCLSTQNRAGKLCQTTNINVERDESFVDDLNKERGSVRTRVGFVLRSAEDLPLFQRFVP